MAFFMSGVKDGSEGDGLNFKSLVTPSCPPSLKNIYLDYNRKYEHIFELPDYHEILTQLLTSLAAQGALQAVPQNGQTQMVHTRHMRKDD